MTGPYSRLLVPIDGSTTAAHGLREAIGLARACEASVVLLTVIELVPMLAEMVAATTWEQVTHDLVRHHRRLLDEAHAALQEAGVAGESHLEDASAARVCDVIVDAALRHRCDLIVMGTHGRRGVTRALLGSDAERVLRTAHCPVLLVPAPKSS